MSFRVIHHTGTVEELRKLIGSKDKQVKEDLVNIFGEENKQEIEEIIDDGNIDNEQAGLYIGKLINERFKPVSNDWNIGAYIDFADTVEGRLGEMMNLFVEGRNPQSGVAGFGIECTCGYLTPAEAKETLELLKKINPEDLKDDVREEFLKDELIPIFEAICGLNTGDLYMVS